MVPSTTTLHSRLRWIAIVASLTVVSACDVFEPTCEDCGGFPLPVATPEAVTFAPGESATVTVRLVNTPGPTDGLPVRWQSTAPEIVQVDSASATGRPTTLRASGVGEARIIGEITHRGVPVGVRIPVIVRAAPDARLATVSARLLPNVALQPTGELW